MIKVSLYYREF